MRRRAVLWQVPRIQRHRSGQFIVPRLEPVLHVVDERYSLRDARAAIVETPNDLLDDLGKLCVSILLFVVVNAL